jgi:hypothetical protein
VVAQPVPEGMEYLQSKRFHHFPDCAGAMLTGRMAGMFDHSRTTQPISNNKKESRVPPENFTAPTEV